MKKGVVLISRNHSTMEGADCPKLFVLSGLSDQSLGRSPAIEMLGPPWIDDERKKEGYWSDLGCCVTAELTARWHSAPKCVGTSRAKIVALSQEVGAGLSLQRPRGPTGREAGSQHGPGVWQPNLLLWLLSPNVQNHGSGHCSWRQRQQIVMLRARALGWHGLALTPNQNCQI